MFCKVDFGEKASCNFHTCAQILFILGGVEVAHREKRKDLNT